MSQGRIARRQDRKATKQLRPLLEDPNRQCGSCTACCYVFEIPGLAKKAGEACKHLRSADVADAREGGCSIHKGPRPDVCSTYVCGWRLGVGDDDERPDKVGYIVNFSPENNSRPWQGVPRTLDEQRERFRAFWLQGIDVTPGACEAARDRLLQIAEERGTAVSIEVKKEDGEVRTQVAGPDSAAMIEALMGTPKRRLPVMR